MQTEIFKKDFEDLLESFFIDYLRYRSGRFNASFISHWIFKIISKCFLGSSSRIYKKGICPPEPNLLDLTSVYKSLCKKYGYKPMFFRDEIDLIV